MGRRDQVEQRVVFIDLTSRRYRTWFFVVCLNLVASSALATENPGGQATFTLRQGGGGAALGPFLEILEDPGGALTIEQVTSPPLARSFIAHHGQHLNEGFSRSAYWLRFTIDFRDAPRDSRVNTDAAWYLDIGRPLVFFKLRLFFPRAGGEWQELRCENGEPAPSTVVRGHALVVPYPSPGVASRTFYLRVEGDTSIFFPLSAVTTTDFLTRSKRLMLFLGVFFGLLVALFCYNLFLWRSLRDRAYLFFVLIVLCEIGYCLGINGLTFEVLSATTGRGATLLFLTLLMSMNLAFAREFLRTRTTSPRYDRVLRGGILLSFVLLALLPIISFEIFSKIVAVGGQLVAVSLFVAGVISARGGYRPARFFLLAWSFFVLGTILYGLTYAGLLPYTNPLFYSLQAGVAISSILFFLALTDRIELLQRERETLHLRQRQLVEMTLTDALTQLGNRRHMMQRLEEEISTASELDNYLSVAMLDVDGFKKFNDRYGHPEGDQVLASLARVIRRSIRTSDIAARYGGEEFFLVLPGVDAEMACFVAERIRLHFKELTFTPAPEQAVHVTVSIGIAQFQTGERTEALVRRADQAMYQAKERGRDRTVIGGTPGGEEPRRMTASGP